MINCGKCKNVVVVDGVPCYKCNVVLHHLCVNWEDTADGRVFVCDNCKVIELPIEYCPRENEEASTSQASMSTEVRHRGLDRELTCILFPGIVKNSDKAIQCLGGIKGISQVQSQLQKKRLGLSFQPDNPFIKKVFSDYKKTAGVLFKIRVKKIRVNNEVQRKVISTDVVGRVSNIHRFESMCDFQYLPVYREASNEPQQCIIDKIIPVGGDDINFIKGESPLFIVPANFTRFDKPINYTYTDKRYPDRSGSPGDDEFHNKSRSDRARPLGHWWQFSLTGDFPSKPDDYYIKIRDERYEYNPSLKKEFEIIKKCFEDRPIWSLNRLKYEVKLRISSLKILVPCVAVYMKDGPWKSLWVRYGFDPRKEPSSRIYQTLDFRLRHQAGVYCMVMTRDQVVHYKSADRVRQTTKRTPRAAPAPPREHVSEGAVLYRPGMVPSQRQIFYQLCDVKLSEVESILSAEPASECHEKLGWLPLLAADTCRDLIFKSVKQTLLASHSADLKFDVRDGGSSDEDSAGSGDDITNDMDESM